MNIVLKRIVSIAIVLLALASQASAQAGGVMPDLYNKANKAEMDHWVDSVFTTLTTERKIGQLFSIIIAGNTSAGNKNHLSKLIREQHIGGILFSKITIRDHAEMVNYAQSLSAVPLMVAVDGEWGLGMRIQNTTPWPKNMMLGAIQNDSLLYYYGLEVARQCRRMGIHVNFAPPLDVNSNPQNPVIGYRSFGEQPRRVAELGTMYSKGLEAGGVMAVAKHFPGHGDTSTDSHFTLPVINHNRERLDNFELVPFKKYIADGLSGVMIAHLNVPALDPQKQPSSLSRSIVTDLLKNEMGFTGLVFTDGMQMKGVASENNHSVRALLAGNDVILSPTYPAREFRQVEQAVADGTISDEMLTDKVKRVLAYKYILGAISKEAAHVDVEDIEYRLNTSYADWLNRKLHENAITLLKDENKVIPLNKLEQRKIAAVSIGASKTNHFLDMVGLYADADVFSVADGAQLAAMKPQLAKYNTIIISVHNRKSSNNAGIQEVIKDKESILAFFVLPYFLESYSPSISVADGVILGYEDTELAHEFTAQAIFGGKEISGRLPVSIGSLYKAGMGIDKKKSRLGYGIPEEAGIYRADLDTIALIVEEGIREKAYPGAQLLIAKDGIIIYSHSFGTYQYEASPKVENSDIFDLASMTKATATVPALMKLHDMQKIKLSEPLSRYVAPLKNTDKDKITIRDALLHETGIVAFIPYYMGAIDRSSYTGGLFSRTYQGVYTARFDATTYARTDYKFKPGLVSKTPKKDFLPLADGLYIHKSYSDSIIQQIADTKLRAKKYLYSCLNFMLLKEAVENISKEPMDEFLDKNFYKKLGATSTTYNPLEKFPKEQIVPTEKDEFLRRQLLQGCVHDEGAAFMGGVSGNAGLFSNANDLAKLYQMWLNDGEYGEERLLSENTVRLFTRGKSATSRRGLGFDKPETRGGKPGPCSPSTPASTYGHTGFTGTSFWVDPDNNLIYIFLSNRVYPNRSQNGLMRLDIRARIQEEIYKAIKKGKKYELGQKG